MTAGSRVVLAASAAFLALVAVAVVAPWLLAPGDPLAAAAASAYDPPAPGHPFGFDELGRDVYTRVVHGAAPSIRIALLGVLGAAVLGVVVGALAVFGGRFADLGVMRLLDVGMALPGLLLALVLITVVGRGEWGIVLAIAIVEFPIFARLARSRLLVVRSSGYVETARGLGVPPLRSLVGHVLPNAITPVVIAASLGIGGAMIFASGLIFLGLGIQPPTPEWGSMLAASRSTIALAWWTGLYPGLAITLSVVAINLVAIVLRGRRR